MVIVPPVPRIMGMHFRSSSALTGVTLESGGAVFTIESPWVTYAKKQRTSRDVVVEAGTSGGTIVLPGEDAP